MLKASTVSLNKSGFSPEYPRSSNQYADKVAELYEQINTLVGDLNQKIDRTLVSHEHNFMDAFKMQMHAVFKQVKDLQARNSAQEYKLKKHKRIEELKKQLAKA